MPLCVRVYVRVFRRVGVCETNRNARSFSKQGWWNDLPRANAISIPGLMSPVSTISLPFSTFQTSPLPRITQRRLLFSSSLCSFPLRPSPSVKMLFASPLSDGKYQRQVETLRSSVKNRFNSLTLYKRFVLNISKLFLFFESYSNVVRIIRAESLSL